MCSSQTRKSTLKVLCEFLGTATGFELTGTSKGVGRNTSAFTTGLSVSNPFRSR